MLPVFYSFRRCPYAIRARLALSHCQQQVALREIVLKDKPAQMLQASPKGTVPVLILPSAEVIDESLDIMFWAMKNNPAGWKLQNKPLIIENDQEFKPWLDKYKYADRYPEFEPFYYREKASEFLHTLDQQLARQDFLAGVAFGFEDAAIAPFIRQCAFVDKNWFDQMPWPNLQRWLTDFLNSTLFNGVMQKHPRWQPDQIVTNFP